MDARPSDAINVAHRSKVYVFLAFINTNAHRLCVHACSCFFMGMKKTVTFLLKFARSKNLSHAHDHFF